jgi:hypothetical protein
MALRYLEFLLTIYSPICQTLVTVRSSGMLTLIYQTAISNLCSQRRENCIIFPEDGSSIFFRYLRMGLPHCTASYREKSVKTDDLTSLESKPGYYRIENLRSDHSTDGFSTPIFFFFFI